MMEKQLGKKPTAKGRLRGLVEAVSKHSIMRRRIKTF